MIEFLRKFEDRGIKIALVNSFLFYKSINLLFFTLILYGDGVLIVMEDDFQFSVHLKRSMINCIQWVYVSPRYV